MKLTIAFLARCCWRRARSHRTGATSITGRSRIPKRNSERGLAGDTRSCTLWRYQLVGPWPRAGTR